MTNNHYKFQDYRTNLGARIFQIPLELFPDFWGYAYFILVDEMKVLIDTGSGFGKSVSQLERGLLEIGEKVGKEINFNSLTHILLTHGHIDHFGGLLHIYQRTSGLIGIHELDLRNITNYEERLALITHRLKTFFVEAGVQDEEVNKLIHLYQLNKQLFHSVKVDFSYETVGMRLDPFEVIHVPGHCAGHVVIRVHNMLFSGDHVLNRITPHMAPESLTSNTGLGHYFKSLDKVAEMQNVINLTLGGHESPIKDLGSRILEIKSHHMDRLDKILGLLNEPKTIAEISFDLFGLPGGYGAILAFEEAGAHIEYLYQRGQIGIENINDLDNFSGPFPLRYRRL